jgi:hypothetical protein
MKLQRVVAVASFLIFSGCGQQGPQPAAVKQPYQRFVPISVPIPREPGNPTGLPWAGAFALDTKTGQLCWTYNVGENRTSNLFPNIPYCSVLFTEHPD